MGNDKKPPKNKGSGRRQLHTKVKTARGRKLSSTRWLQRQLNDPYVARAQADGYRSRAAYKLIEIDEQFHFLKKGAVVVDLGAAPGGWTQVAVQKVGSQGKVVGIDLTEIEPIAGAILLQHDFMDDDAPALLDEAVGGKADVVLSDMAAPSCGHAPTDHIRIMALCETALHYAKENLKPGGVFVSKILQGGAEKELLDDLKKNFTKVKHIKPPASRSDSSEMYVVGVGFKSE